MPEQQPSSTSAQELNKQQKFQQQQEQQWKQSIAKGNQMVIGMKKQLQIQNEKIKQHQEKKRQKVSQIYKKSIKNKYASFQEIYEQQQQLEVPVDGQLQRGSRIFMMHCSSCHSLDVVTNKNMRGPSLGLIFNRRVASDPHYEGYSEAAIKSQKFWTAKSLYRFMYSPQDFIRGTTCNILKGEGLKSQQDRADIIEFLRGYTQELSKNIQIKQVRSKGYGQVQTNIYVQQEMQKRKSL